VHVRSYIAVAWALLIAAISAEIIATTALARSDGFSKLLPSVITIVGYVTAFGLLSQVVKSIPVSVAYAVWSGAGTALVAAIGITFLGESISWLKIAGLAFVVVGVVALNLGGAH
jgi:small multidrug resistance pump